MSKLAPGKWHPLDRRLAKAGSFLVGCFLIWLGYKLAVPLVDTLKSGGDPSWFAYVFAGAPLVLGVVAALPDIFKPLIVLAIQKFLTDSPDK